MTANSGASRQALFDAGQIMRAVACADRFALLDLALRSRFRPGLVLEFGVFEGGSLRFIAEHCGGTAHGFDSFEGLPEDWRPGFPKGAFAGGPSRAMPPNVEIHAGLFENMLPAFLDTHRAPIAFLHVDCDLYRSTRTVLDLCADRLVPGTVIVFDEYCGYPEWREHEHKAFAEFLIQAKRTSRLLGLVEHGEQAAFVLA
ncbi:class I SAM-dependent methyltransferase [Allosphingosinicella deserti]|uniref:class I SAM-dependent methyltransferase n=1 Tax=Allosphingosinicella deserti TaxID=2116704 RepID=UPI0011B2693B|nr:class I SAM-dependent methyltransferase [Sphingomonas deserti]